MTWLNEISWVEYSFIGFFLLMYLVYFVRVWLISRMLGATSRSIIIKFLLRFTYIGLLITAILGPSIGTENRVSKTTGRDLYLAVDLSNSMNANDVQPTRLERTKFELLGLINRLNESRIGLIAFSSEAFTLAPLTYDTNALKLFIQQLSTKMMVNGGTSLASVLNEVVQKYRSSQDADRYEQTVLIITDGEDFDPLPDSTIRAIKKNFINVFFLGVGTTQGSKIPLENGGVLKDKSGDEVISKLNLTTIQSVLTKTNGKYFRLNQEHNDIDALVTTILELKSSRIDERKFKAENNRYYYFLWVALILIIFDIAFTVRIIKT